MPRPRKPKVDIYCGDRALLQDLYARDGTLRPERADWSVVRVTEYWVVEPGGLARVDDPYVHHHALEGDICQLDKQARTRAAWRAFWTRRHRPLSEAEAKRLGVLVFT